MRAPLKVQGEPFWVCSWSARTCRWRVREPLRFSQDNKVTRWRKDSYATWGCLLSSIRDDFKKKRVSGTETYKRLAAVARALDAPPLPHHGATEVDEERVNRWIDALPPRMAPHYTHLVRFGGNRSDEAWARSYDEAAQMGLPHFESAAVAVADDEAAQDAKPSDDAREMGKALRELVAADRLGEKA